MLIYAALAKRAFVILVMLVHAREYWPRLATPHGRPVVVGKFVASRAKRLHGVPRSFVVDVSELSYYDVRVLIHGSAERPQTKVL